MYLFTQSKPYDLQMYQLLAGEIFNNAKERIYYIVAIKPCGRAEFGNPNSSQWDEDYDKEIGLSLTSCV